MKRKRILFRIMDNKGSATVEASLVIPVFLMAVCALFFIGQLLLVEGEVHYSLTQAARTCAEQEAVKMAKRSLGQSGDGSGKDGDHGKEESGDGLGLGPQGIFMGFYDGGALCDACIAGGGKAVVVSGKRVEGRETVRLTARYVLKVPVFLFRTIVFPREITVEERIFSGYIPHTGENADRGKDYIVYVTERGTVYHRRADCTHICLSIRDADAIKGVIHSGRYRPCEKCIKKNGSISTLYITAEGDCYHSSLSCSGLKRTVRAVYLSEIPGMRPCSRCAAGH